MQNIIIRNLKKDDTDIISFILERLSNVWKMTKVEIMEEFIEASFNGEFPYVYIALTNKSEFAGMIIASIEKNWFLGIDNEVWIGGLYVVDKFRNQGIAQNLINKVEEVVKDNGYNSIYLDTVDAEEYYKKIGGWVEIGKDVYKGDQVVIMKKEI